VGGLRRWIIEHKFAVLSASHRCEVDEMEGCEDAHAEAGHDCNTREYYNETLKCKRNVSKENMRIEVSDNTIRVCIPA